MSSIFMVSGAVTGEDPRANAVLKLKTRTFEIKKALNRYDKRQKTVH